MSISGTKMDKLNTPDICIIGAGFSGLCAAIRIKQKLGIDSFNIFEKHSDVGGTWMTNTYPGCACDVQSHLYSLSFELNPNWSKSFSSQPEIWEYQKSLAKKYDLYSHAQFNTEVKQVVWDEKIKKWKVTFINIGEGSTKQDPQDEHALFDIIFNGTGILRIPNVPQEFLTFKGPIIHSAQWDSTIQLENKIVAVVGSGASAIQIIPSIADKVKELHVFQRKPSWIYKSDQFLFHEMVKTLFACIPLLMWMYRAAIFLRNELTLLIFQADSLVNKIATYTLNYYRKSFLGDNEKLSQDLTPKYKLGCKRIVISDIFYSAMALPHVKLHTKPIEEVSSCSLKIKDGHTQNIDVLILATGYRYNDFFAPLDIIGKNGEDILKSWVNLGPSGYLGIVSSSMPNLFTLLGPNSNLGHNSVLFQVECQIDFTLKIIEEMIRRNARSVTIKSKVEADYMAKMKKQMKGTIWGTTECGSWYTNSKGEVTALYPSSCISYWMETKMVEFSKFDFEYL